MCGELSRGASEGRKGKGKGRDPTLGAPKEQQHACTAKLIIYVNCICNGEYVGPHLIHAPHNRQICWQTYAVPIDACHLKVAITNEEENINRSITA